MKKYLKKFPKIIISFSVITPWKAKMKKIKKKIKVLQTQLQREKKKKVNKNSFELKYAMLCLKQYLPEETMSFIESQVTMSQRKSKKAYRWKVKDKMLALSIFFHC